MGLIPPLVTDETAVISDELNHNCIINSIALSRPAEKHIYRHVDMGELERALEASTKTCRRAIVVTDGIFSMRGDHAPLDRIMGLARAYDAGFAENAIVVVDDSHDAHRDENYMIRDWIFSKAMAGENICSWP
jgi:glycine C-acetyltransferase